MRAGDVTREDVQIGVRDALRGGALRRRIDVASLASDHEHGDIEPGEQVAPILASSTPSLVTKLGITRCPGWDTS